MGKGKLIGQIQVNAASSQAKVAKSDFDSVKRAN